MKIVNSFGCAFALIAALGCGPAISAAQEVGWDDYYDSAYGCRLDYPGALFSAESSEPGKPKRFSASQEDIYFRVLGMENVSSWTPQNIKEEYLNANMPGDVTYQRTKDEFLVLSGYRGSNIFYTKVAVSEDRRIVCILDITYPRSLKKRFDGIVTRMSHSFEVSR
jgi:hypothetical protein